MADENKAKNGSSNNKPAGDGGSKNKPANGGKKDSKSKKSSGGMISLVLVIIALGLMAAAAIPMQNIRDTGVMLSGWFNVAFSAGAFVFALAAIVASAASKKNGKRSGAAKAGLAIGIISIIISLMLGMGTCTISLLSDYANNGEGSLLGKNVKEDAEKKAKLDEFIDELLKGTAPVSKELQSK